jgi:hypothetical protein
MTVKVYGRSDAELEFLNQVCPRFKEIGILSFEQFNDFSKNPNKYYKEILDAADSEIESIKEEIRKAQVERKNAFDRNKELGFKMSKKINVIHHQWGTLKQKTQAEINDLKWRKNHNQSVIEDLGKKINQLYSDLDKKKDERTQKEENLRDDLDTLKEIKSEQKFLNLCKGAWGEQEVIKYVRDAFKDQDNFYLLNSFNLDVMNKAININDKIVVEDKIDHILICPRGFFALETKAWEGINDDELNRLINQLKRTKLVLNTIFKDLTEKTEVILICTKKHLELPREVGFTSLMLNELGDYLSKKETIFNGDNITEVLNMILPYSSAEHSLPKYSLKAKGLFIKVKRFVKGKIYKNK